MLSTETLHSVLTVVLMLSFLALAYFVYRPEAKEIYRQRGNIPLDFDNANDTNKDRSSDSESKKNDI